MSEATTNTDERAKSPSSFKPVTSFASAQTTEPSRRIIRDEKGTQNNKIIILLNLIIRQANHHLFGKEQRPLVVRHTVCDFDKLVKAQLTAEVSPCYCDYKPHSPRCGYQSSANGDGRPSKVLPGCCDDKLEAQFHNLSTKWERAATCTVLPGYCDVWPNRKDCQRACEEAEQQPLVVRHTVCDYDKLGQSSANGGGLALLLRLQTPQPSVLTSDLG